jgi:D-glycero-alpha-D-manno-heptose-7-phosphate kinase
MKNTLKRIHSTAPVRICDIGGWTDTWFAGHGAVFNIGVTPVVEVKIVTYPQDRDERVTLCLGNFNETYSLDPDRIEYDRHPLIEAAVDMIGVPPGISLEIDIFSEVPSGASVGTSAAVSVALIGALDALTPGRLSAHEIAGMAHKVETEKLGLQSGIQDQLCSAYGGIHFIDMHSFPDFRVYPVETSEEFKRELEKRLALIYIGTPHNSSDVHKMVIADLGEDASNDPRLERLRRLAMEARDAVSREDFTALGQVMNRNTEAQRALHPGLVCDKFEELIRIAGSFGVLGCKVNGAGGDGGSITILGDGDEEKKKKLIDTLEEKGFHSIPLTLSPHGVCVRVEDVGSGQQL